MNDMSSTPSHPTSDRSRTLVLEVRQGLANRICAWVAGARLAEVYGRELRLVWPVEPACPCRFEELFEPTVDAFGDVAACLAALGAAGSDVREHVVGDLTDCLRGLDLAAVPERILVVRSPFFCHDASDRPARMAFASLSPRWASEPFADEKTIAVFETVRTQLAGPVKRFLGAIIPRADIIATVNDFTARCFEGPVVGVHLRGTDNPRCRSLTGMLLGTIDRLTASPAGPLVFVAGDDRATIDRAMTVGHGRVVTFVTSHDPTVFRQTAMRDALVDMLLMARTDRIYKAPFSSFGIVSAAIGDVPVSVIHRHWLRRLPEAFARLVTGSFRRGR